MSQLVPTQARRLAETPLAVDAAVGPCPQVDALLVSFQVVGVHEHLATLGALVGVVLQFVLARRLRWARRRQRRGPVGRRTLRLRRTAGEEVYQFRGKTWVVSTYGGLWPG